MEKLETEYGTFTNNEETGETAQQVYERWLANKDKVVTLPPTNADLQAQIFNLITQLVNGGVI
ncbi:hypothetical protein [Clostridium sp. YIM B02569]|uniref:hypothetical protein n=1 Tax=Clostridium sp. YIM B02569 TaxID=2911967 RepID=UPI001EEAF9E8|nr:hypothetical protein [Clostridium sp. YIM B02569]